MLEAHIKKAVKQRLAEIGCWSWWPVTRGMGQQGLDAIVCLPGGIFAAIETKRPGGRPTPRQLVTIEAIRAAGGIVHVVDSIEAARNLFEWI